jgi:hypothetical protein
VRGIARRDFLLQGFNAREMTGGELGGCLAGRRSWSALRRSSSSSSAARSSSVLISAFVSAWLTASLAADSSAPSWAARS